MIHIEKLFICFDYTMHPAIVVVIFSSVRSFTNTVSWHTYVFIRRFHSSIVLILWFADRKKHHFIWPIACVRSSFKFDFNFSVCLHTFPTVSTHCAHSTYNLCVHVRKNENAFWKRFANKPRTKLNYCVELYKFINFPEMLNRKIKLFSHLFRCYC